MTIQITDHSPKTYIILGMHQGGTSFLAKALQEQGIDMGIIEQGVFENPEFVQFNNKTLSDAGGSWDYPPPMEALIGMADREELDRLFEKYEKDKWGFKDPRTAALGDVYLPNLEDDSYIIAIFRKPEKVANSIGRKKHMGEKQALKLTKEYYRRIIGTIKKFAGI